MIVLLVGAAVLLVVAFVLVLVEAAFGQTSQIRMETLAESDQARAGRVIALLEHPEKVLNPLRLVIVLVLLTQASLVAIWAGGRFDAAGWIVLAVAVNGAVVFVGAEAAPRTLGLLHADRVALALTTPVVALIGLPPVRFLAKALIGLANVIVPGRGLHRGPFALPEELIALADAAVEDSVLEQDERDLIESVIEFGDTVVREVMVHRTDMTTVEQAATVDEVLEIASELGYSRLPVEGDNIDDIVGLAYVKDLIRAELDDRDDEPVGGLLRPPRFVPETKRVAHLLREMQEESFHMAVVVDEYGGVAGLVTLEDLIEELVGEIVDEYDVEEPLLVRDRDGTLRVDARIGIDELNDLVGLELPEGDWDTVGGLVLDRFGRVPSEGETCDCEGYLLRVERIQGRRVQRVRILGHDPRSTTSSVELDLNGDVTLGVNDADGHGEPAKSGGTAAIDGVVSDPETTDASALS